MEHAARTRRLSALCAVVVLGLFTSGCAGLLPSAAVVVPGSATLVYPMTGPFAGGQSVVVCLTQPARLHVTLVLVGGGEQPGSGESLLEWNGGPRTDYGFGSQFVTEPLEPGCGTYIFLPQRDILQFGPSVEVTFAAND